MKRSLTVLIMACLMIFVFLAFKNTPLTRALAQTNDPAQIKMPEVIVLAQHSKLGPVTFNHIGHNGGKYNIEGTGPIACIECHHAAQPASELAKYPPLKTSWPAGRTTTLTAELFAKDPKAAGVAACRDCHARTGDVPKLIPAMPVIKEAESTALIMLTNQMAFHRACDSCHFQVGFQRPNAKVPSPTSCVSCHKPSPRT